MAGVIYGKKKNLTFNVFNQTIFLFARNESIINFVVTTPDRILYKILPTGK